MGRFFAITPAPAGANRIRPSGNAGLWNFNSRPRERGESSLAGYPIRARPTSTPAPVWGGELSCLTRLRYPPSRFNSRSRVGEQCTGCRQQRYTRFNSRPMWGRTYMGSTQFKAFELQLTPPCGGEPYGTIIVLGELRAPTHAPVWGRTSDTCQICWPASGFNSRPRTGANLT